MNAYEPSRNSGKADENCRTCTDFRSWAKKQRKNLFTGRNEANSDRNEDLKINEQSRKDCPLDKDDLGRATWGLLHTVGATYPEKPTNEQENDVKQFFNIISRIYPCSYCADDLKIELSKDPIDTSSQDGLSQWLCRLHNKVNVKLGKPIFDCSKVNERWRDGWMDGSCD